MPEIKGLSPANSGEENTDAVQYAVDNAPPCSELKWPRSSSGIDQEGYLLGNVYIDKPLTFAGQHSFGSRIIAAPGTEGFIFNFKRGSTYKDFNHLYGIHLKDLFFDGNGRSVDCGAIDMFLVDRSSFQNVNIWHFRREALRAQSLRESLVFNTDVRHCGTGQVPAVDLSDTQEVDANNNLRFIGFQLVYPHGTGLKIKPTSSHSMARNLFFRDCLFHGIEGFREDIGLGSGYGKYPVTATETTRYLIDIAGARFVEFSGRIHSPGRGMPLVRISEGAWRRNRVIFNTCHFGHTWPDSIEVKALPDGRIYAPNHRFPTGARVRFGTSNQDYFVLALNSDYFKVCKTRDSAESGMAMWPPMKNKAIMTAQTSHIDISEGEVGITGWTVFGGPKVNRANVIEEGGKIVQSPEYSVEEVA